MAFVRFNSGPRTGETVTLGKSKTTFGRHKRCDCRLDHATVSREHFYIEQNGEKYFLVDQESNNGTFANDERVSWVELKDGDTFRAGPFNLVFKISDEQNQAEASTGEEDQEGKAQETDTEPRAFDGKHEKIYPREYLAGIDHFNGRRYYDAHEIWEEIWLRSEGETKLFYQMLIQAAVGLHHYERGNSLGGRGMYKNVMEKIGRLPSLYMSLDTLDFSRQFESFFAELIEGNDEAAPPADKLRPTIRLLSSDTDD